MKKILSFLLLTCALCSCSSSHQTEVSCPVNVVAKDDALTRPRSSCPPAAFGAEKVAAALDKAAAPKPATVKTDPVTGKKTSKAKGIRTGELERAPKLTKDERAAKKRAAKEDKLLLKQMKRDEREAKRQSSSPY